jgi:general secretion pathway protein A
VLLRELHHVLSERRACGQITALVIDEAQSLSGELLEEIRLLANIETPTQKLLPLVLAGQPELRGRLNEPGLRQLKQRVTLRCEIVPLNLEETCAYIAFRVGKAGGDASKLFTREAVKLIYEQSRGIPRVISVICDNALVNGCALQKHLIDRAIISEVARDFDLEIRVPKSDHSTRPSAEIEATQTQDQLEHAPVPDGVDVAERGMFAATAARRRFSLFRGR